MEYIKRNRIKINARSKKYRDDNPLKVKEVNIKCKYGLTLKNYNDLVKKQENKCKLCLKLTPKLHIDHCHNTNKIRGLLCSSCNTSLGKLGDTVEKLQKAVDYLKGELYE